MPFLPQPTAKRWHVRWSGQGCIISLVSSALPSAANCRERRASLCGGAKRRGNTRAREEAVEGQREHKESHSYCSLIYEMVSVFATSGGNNAKTIS